MDSSPFKSPKNVDCMIVNFPYNFCTHPHPLLQSFFHPTPLLNLQDEDYEDDEEEEKKRPPSRRKKYRKKSNKYKKHSKMKRRKGSSNRRSDSRGSSNNNRRKGSPNHKKGGGSSSRERVPFLVPLMMIPESQVSMQTDTGVRNTYLHI